MYTILKVPFPPPIGSRNRDPIGNYVSLRAIFLMTSRILSTMSSPPYDSVNCTAAFAVVKDNTMDKISFVFYTCNVIHYRKPLASGIGVPYRPLKVGCRFSRKAATASIMSSLGMSAAFFWAM